ncbi:putative leucine-rich repeat domain superfamily [Helianthus annuus]|uniref:Leucine-rich repeat domain superfamily n=2 Tax=Helianthus annuus TaxID=4232 RepID=A0A251UWW5_HELAN|nr:putative leucine-rich repeat domain superfamily [Helianthus annuus]KAJ0930349.1 putative leucine-rich repeat domain superfamily [Helianthus annuus]
MFLFYFFFSNHRSWLYNERVSFIYVNLTSFLNIMAKSFHLFMLILLLHVLEYGLANKFSSLSHADECTLLFQFKENMPINKYASVDSDAYLKVASWNFNTSDGAINGCLWDGVECRFGHVIGLDLSSSFLYGPIDSNNSLFSLVHLRTLNLADNHFRFSQIPSGIGRLSQLANLNLSYSAFNGEVPKQISQLGNLVSLDLTRNWDGLKLHSSDFQVLVQKSSKTLRELHLSEVKIDSTIPASIGNLAHLNILDLSSCGFTGTLPASLNNLTQLTVLDLSGNKFSGPIQPSIGNLTHLKMLDLSRCVSTGSLPSLESFSNLTYLSLSENIFDRWKLPDWFGKLNKITYLNLDDVNLNQLKGSFPSSLLNSQNLESFYLNDNNVTVNFYPFLSLKKLKYLNLNGNNITFPVMGGRTNETQAKFKYLSLRSCDLKDFPELIRFQNQLEYLYLDNNKIEGVIPKWMWNISKGTLDLSNNMLHGSIPVPPPTTKYFSLSNNMLTGEIPSTICELLSLKFLDFSFNNITGSIPPCLEKLSHSMVVLNLRSNTLHGTIPNIFTNGSRLQMIDLSENKLQGHVPRSLEKCESLMILDLGYNFIEDMFPFWLGALSELQVLILRFNRFHGTITIRSKIKVNFPKLHIIDLSYNSFCGDLPHQYFQAWSAMKETKVNARRGYYQVAIQMTNKGVKMEYVEIINIFSAVDLSSNRFRGKIPESIKTLSGLQVLNLSNNELSDVIPPSMGNLIRLESLDLSSNKLPGVIPQDLVQLNFLEVLNLSNNKLIGPIPQGRHFDTFSNDSFMGNALCGYPLSMKCGDSKASNSPKVSFEEDNESDFPNGIDWVVILIVL